MNQLLIKNIPAITLSYGLPAAINLSLDLYHQKDLALNSSSLISASDSFYALFDYLSPSFLENSTLQSFVDYISDFIACSDGNLFERVLVSALRTSFLEVGSKPTFFDLQSMKYSINMVGDVDDGTLKGFDVVIRRAEANFDSPVDILQLSKSVLAQPSDHFFEDLVSTLQRILAVDVVIAASLNSRDFTVLAGCYHGDVEYGFRDAIVGSPFADLQGGFHYHSEGVTENYPQCVWLVQKNIQSMLSIPLLGADGECIGVISLLHSSAIVDLEFARTLLTVFSARASSEIEYRQMAFDSMLRHQRYQELIEKSQSGMFVLDIEPPMPAGFSQSEQLDYLLRHARFTECNPTYLQLQGLLNDHDLLSQSLSDIVGDDIAQELFKNFVAQGFNLNDCLSQSKRVAANQWLSSSYSGQLQDNCLTHIYGICNDVSERMEYTRLLAFQANHDELTELPNRRYFKELFEQAIIDAGDDELLALFILDLDGFKEVNDTLGHLTGDELLKLIGPRIQEVLSQYNVLLARLGGDEFGLLVNHANNESELLDVAINIMQAIKTPFSVSGLDLRVSGSIGISHFPRHGNDFSSLMRCADVAMYRAKDFPKDFEIYQPEDDYYSVRRLSLMMEMRQAVEDEQLVLYYQPITRIDDKSIKGFEALVRWNHPKHGLIPPGEFIPLIELTDVIEPMTWWVIETAVKQLQIWQREGKGYTLSVNVSTRNISEDSFVYRLSRLLRKYDVDGRFLEIEITESTLMADPNKGRSVLNAMSVMGIKFAIDDFGTGYSSLAYLKSLPINTLKIDRTFIDQMLSNEQDQIIVKSTIQLAHNLGMKVTAEGIEDYRLIAVLFDLGCDYGQGYFICRPIPVEQLECWIDLYEQGRHPISTVR